MGEVPAPSSLTPPQQVTAAPPPSMIVVRQAPPAREDCWSEEATFTLIEAWGQRYLELNRGNLRQKQWQEVADTVNARHGHVKKARRTDVQCKNRIDTLKKKYKIEKARVLDSQGNYVSPWPFFLPLDRLIGSTLPIKKITPPAPPPIAVPLKRPSPSPIAAATPYRMAEAPPPSSSSSYFRRNYSAAIAAAAAAAAESESEDDDNDEIEVEEERDENEEERDEEEEVSAGGGEAEGIRKLARVIERFGEVYARVEAEKQRQMIELEKQRMQFAKELECQRMQMLVEMQVQLEKIKRAKRSDSNDMYS